MHDPKLKARAIAMRKQGKGISNIANEFGLNKTTVSYWCRDVALSENMIRALESLRKSNAKIALLKYAEINRANRIVRTNKEKVDGANLVRDLSNKNLLFFGLGLYWGEGYKESNGELGFTNSNPQIIKFYICWLKLFGVKEKDLILRLTINIYFKKYEKSIKLFWINLLKVDKSQFSKTTVIKSFLKKGSKDNLQNYKGILRVKVRRGLSLKNKILGAIDYVATHSKM